MINILYDVVFSFIGAFIGTLLAIFYDHAKKPEINIVEGSRADGNYENIGKVRFLHIKIKNCERKNWFKRFIQGYIIMSYCKTELEFLDPITKAVKFRFQGRWSSTPEPYISFHGEKNKGIFDPSKAVAGEIENIFPGESKEIAVVLKIDGDKKFVGFNNWSYLYEKWWNKDFEIKNDSTLVRIIIRWSTGKKQKLFVISNPQEAITNFQLQEMKE